jgi:hypothetical protein
MPSLKRGDFESGRSAKKSEGLHTVPHPALRPRIQEGGHTCIRNGDKVLQGGKGQGEDVSPDLGSAENRASSALPSFHLWYCF